MKTIHQLRAAGIIVSITHYMEEAAQADRVLVMSRGRIVMEGTRAGVQPDRAAQLPSGCTQAAELRDEAGQSRYPDAGERDYAGGVRGRTFKLLE